MENIPQVPFINDVNLFQVGRGQKRKQLHCITFTIQIWTDFHESEAKEKKKDQEKRFKMADFSKWLFFKIANSQKFFAKTSQIGPWVSRID